jgi:hypothetical protein
MGKIEPDFYMTSSEDDNFKQLRKCYRVKQIHTSRRDDYLLIQVSPPFIDSKTGDSSDPIDHLIIASRHKGVLLSSIRKWPVAVYVLRSLIDNPDQGDNLKDTELELLGWAEIYPSQLSIG